MKTFSAVCATLGVLALTACSGGSSGTGMNTGGGTDGGTGGGGTGGGDGGTGGGGGTPVADGAVKNANGSVTVTSSGETVELPAATVVTNGQPSWIQTGLLANGFESDNALAVGGVQDGTVFSGITGTLSTPPSGSATFTGRYAVNTAASSVSSPIVITYDGSSDALTAADSRFSIDGTVAGSGAATGTVTFEGVDADFEGGFYGAGDVAGAFNNDTFGGVFYGSAPE